MNLSEPLASTSVKWKHLPHLLLRVVFKWDNVCESSSLTIEHRIINSIKTLACSEVHREEPECASQTVAVAASFSVGVHRSAHPPAGANLCPRAETSLIGSYTRVAPSHRSHQCSFQGPHRAILQSQGCQVFIAPSPDAVISQVVSTMWCWLVA